MTKSNIISNNPAKMIIINLCSICIKRELFTSDFEVFCGMSWLTCFLFTEAGRVELFASSLGSVSGSFSIG